MRVLEEVVDLGAGPVAVAALVEAVRGGDVDAGLLSDEELCLLGLDDGSGLPRLSGLTEGERDVALTSALWVLRARGVVQAGADGDLRFVGLPAVVGDARWGADATTRVRVDVRGQGSRHVLVHHVRPGLFLTEETVDDGLHQFTFRSAPAQAAWLAACADPLGRARETGPARGATDDARLAAASETSALVHAPERHRSFTAYGGPDGLQVLQGWHAPDGTGEVSLQHLGPRDLVAFCGAFLA